MAVQTNENEKILQNNQVDQWIDSLYKGNDIIFEVEFEGKVLKFKKRFPVGVAFQMQKKPQEEQLYQLIAILSVQPTLTEAQAKLLPQDFVTIFGKKLKEFFDLDSIKKALPPKAS